MIPEEIYGVLDEAIPPFAIKTKGGRTHWITDRSQIWTPERSLEMVCLAIPGKGIMVLRLSQIESIQIEHHPAGLK